MYLDDTLFLYSRNHSPFTAVQELSTVADYSRLVTRLVLMLVRRAEVSSLRIPSTSRMDSALQNLMETLEVLHKDGAAESMLDPLDFHLTSNNNGDGELHLPDPNQKLDSMGDDWQAQYQEIDALTEEQTDDVFGVVPLIDDSETQNMSATESLSPSPEDTGECARSSFHIKRH
jgi:hypothetical protein